MQRLARLRSAVALSCSARACIANSLSLRLASAGAGDVPGEPPQAQQAAAAVQASMDFPGGRVPFTTQLAFVGGHFSADAPPMSCYRTVDGAGEALDEADVPWALDEEHALRIYRAMVGLQTMDVIFYDSQRQGRFSFYMTSAGEEATAVGSAAALAPEDVVFAQYREQGVLLYRGFSFLDFAHQCFGNHKEPGKGRQMPIHYGSAALNFHTISSPLATQLPHAVGAAYALKLEGRQAVVAAYFGEGAASEGDFHAAVNFAAVLGAPVLFICRNNGWAISTPATEQYRGDGIAGRGPAYGIPSVRVDGGDVRAVYNATAAARDIALKHSCSVLIEAMSYRSGHHSTSDDSSRYRTAGEMAAWRARDPAARFRRLLDAAGWWDDAKEQTLRQTLRKEVVAALGKAQREPKAPVEAMFADVYAELPWHLAEQQAEVAAHMKRNPGACPDVPIK